jgi:hypothetical protein
VEATLAQVLVEEKAQGQKGDGGGRVPPFIEVGDIEKKGGLSLWPRGGKGGGGPRLATSGRCDRSPIVAGTGGRRWHRTVDGH